MVVTRAQEVSTSYAGGHHQGVKQLEAGPLTSKAGVPAQPSSPHQDDRIATLTMQVQSPVAAVQVLQQQPTTAQRHPESSSSVSGVVQPSQLSTHGRSLWETRRRRASPRHHHREAFKRPRSLCHANASSKRRHGKDTEHIRPHRRYPSPSSESLREGSFDGRIAHRAERRLDEYNQRLEELSRRITNPP